jgi:hypothetical protein
LYRETPGNPVFFASGVDLSDYSNDSNPQIMFFVPPRGAGLTSDIWLDKENH